MKITSLCIAALCLSALAGTANAQSLREKQQIAQEEESMKSSIEHVAKSCGQAIPLKWDWSGFKMADLQTYSPSSYCGEALSAVANICQSSPDGKEAVVKSIKTIQCGASTPRSLTLKDGTLSFGIEWAAPNNQDAVNQFLLDNL